MEAEGASEHFFSEFWLNPRILSFFSQNLDFFPQILRIKSEKSQNSGLDLRILNSMSDLRDISFFFFLLCDPNLL